MAEDIKIPHNTPESIIAIANARLKLADLERKSRQQKETDDPFLYAAIYSCIEAPNRLPAEIASIDEAIESTIKAAPLDPKTKVRVGYLEWTKQNLTWQVERAADMAQKRLDHLKALDTPAKRKAEIERCERDNVYWFKWYAWTVDPRNNILWAVPFVLFEYQVEFINWIDDLIYKRRTSGLTDKSRDMGATWTLSAYFTKQWMMPKGGGSFQALVGSIKASDVDELGNPSTILEKMRLQFKLTPKWMLPRDFNPSFPLMKCVNPENGSVITGETANEDFGRSGRYTVIWFDEFAKFELAEAAYTASSQSANTRLFTFTPYGKTNYAYKLRFRGNMPVMSLHWTRHPFKTKEWYEGQKLDMTPAQVAQELDIDYEGSQEGRIYPEFNEVYHVITQSEFMAAFPDAKDKNGNFKVPAGSHVGMGQDWGSSEGDAHKNMILWFFVLKQNSVTTKGIDLSGSVFIFHEHRVKARSTVRMCANYIKEYERSVHIDPRYMSDRLMSHEAKSERDTYSQEHSLDFRAWSTDLNAGIAQVKDYLELHAFHQPHPFREYTREEDFPEVKPIMGRPRLFLIVDDDQGSLQFDETMGRWNVTAPEDDEGLYWTRFEFPLFHNPEEDESSNKPTKRLKPVKKQDDAMDVVRCVAATFFPPIGKLTVAEKVELAMPEHLKMHNIMKESPEEKSRSYIVRHQIEKEVIKKIRNVNAISWRERVYDKQRGI